MIRGTQPAAMGQPHWWQRGVIYQVYALIDQVEVGERVAGPVRLAFEVQHAQAAVDAGCAAGARLVHPPVRTPWGHYNARLAAPNGMQLTFFQILDEMPSTGSGV